MAADYGENEAKCSTASKSGLPSGAVMRRIALSTALTIGLFAVALVGFVANFNAERRTRHTLEVLAEISALSGALADTEAGQRGFLLTGEEGRLSRYYDSRTTISEKIVNLRRLTADNAQQQANLGQLQPLVSSRLGQLEDVLKTRRALGLEAAAKQIALGVGNETTTEIRSVLARMIQEERALLTRRQSAASATEVALLSVQLILIFLLVAAYVRNQRETHSRSLAEKAMNRVLEQQNSALEDAVAQRTADLDSSNKMLELAQQTARIGSWEWRVEENRLVFSAEMHRLFGTDPENFAATYEHAIERVHPDDRERVHNAVLRTLEDGAPYDIDYRLRPKKEGDAEVHVNARGAVIRDEDGRPVLFSGTLLDITERKKFETALENKQAFLSAILESVQDGIVACDSQGRLSIFNRAAREFHGLDARSMPSNQWAAAYDLYEGDGKTPLIEAKIPLLRAYRGEIVEHCDMVVAPQGLPARRFVTKATPLRDEFGRIIGALATMHDVTVEHAQKQLLRARLNELELILNNVPVRIWFKDDKNRIIRLNRHAADSMGVRIEDAEGVDTYALFPEMAQKYHEDDLEVIDKGVPKRGIIEEYTPRDADSGWVITDKVPYRDPHTGERFVFVASMDVTATVKAQEELRRTNAELEQFARVASHDLQEPLRKLVIFSEFLEHDLGDDLPDKAKGDLEAITSSARRMQSLVKDILTLARMRPKDVALEAIDARLVVLDCMELLASQCRNAAAVVLYDDLPHVVADLTLLRQVYQNLIANALKFVPQGRTPRLQFTVELQGRRAILGVKDNGIGIDPENLQKIFDPFTRLHAREEFEGTGMGLAICRKAVESLGGTIWAESTPGVGSHFRFSLRTVSSETARAPIRASASE